MNNKLHLYFDDSGSRRPDHKPNIVRKDGMDCFALGGILIQEGENILSVIDSYKRFSQKWGIDYPLHSTKIRCRQKSFSWLHADPEREKQFLDDLELFLLAQPVLGIACVVNRQGYIDRYASRYAGEPWLMCKTAFAILIERAVKYAKGKGAKLEIFFEQTGKNEDHDIKQYMKELKSGGMPFNKDSSQVYEMLSSGDFKEIVLGEPQERTKKSIMIQPADLFLYSIAKSGYDSAYPPYRKLMDAGKIIDSHLPENQLSRLGVKYSCFDSKK